MAKKALKVGDTAPDFEALSDSGKTIKLSDFRGKRVVLYFYPKDSTPGCTTQACGFRDSYPTVEKRKAVVLGVSPDGVASHQKFKTNQKLPFPLVVDQDHAIAEAYGVWGEKSMYGKKYMGVNRETFLIDKDGIVRKAWHKVKPEDHANEVLETVDALNL